MHSMHAKPGTMLLRDVIGVQRYEEDNIYQSRKKVHCPMLVCLQVYLCMRRDILTTHSLGHCCVL